MFFSIGRTPDTRFPNHTKVLDWWFSHDNGWEPTSTGWFKGYRHSDVLAANYAELVVDGGTIRLEHENERAFPLWHNAEHQTLTNLLGSGDKIWTANRVSIDSAGINVCKHPALGSLTSLQQTASLDQVLDRLEQNLTDKFLALKRDYDHLPRYLFLSGGIDTALVQALVNKVGLEYTALDYEYFEYDDFTNYNWEEIRTRHWGYSQIHHWRRPSMLLTGACGDEFLFRGPATIALWAAWHNIDLNNILSKSTGYHVGYFAKPSNAKIFDDAYRARDAVRAKYPTYTHLVRELLNSNINDHQYWHMGNTLTHTPFKDIELTKLILTLPPDVLLEHIVDAKICKMLIKRIDARCLDLIAPTKNLNARRQFVVKKQQNSG